MQQPPSQWDHALEALLLVLLAFCPFAFGARDDWTQQVWLGLAAAWSPEIVLILAAALAAVLAARQVFQRHARFVWTWAYLPILLFLLVGIFQLIPLSANWLGRLSPQTLKTKSDLLGNLPDAPRLLHSLTLSFYPLATRHDLWMLLSVVTVFVVVLNVYRRSTQIKRLLLGISIIGFAVALLALYQTAFGSRMIYGIVPAVHLNSGPFLNHNAFSQFVNLSIGAMLALLLVRLREITEGSRTFGESFQVLRYAKLNWIYALGAMILLSAATVFLSLSRGGVISLLIAGAVTGILLIWRRGKGGISSILMMLALGALLVVFYAASGPVFQRLSTLRHAGLDSGDRAHVAEYVAREARQYPLFGTGLGTHRYIYPMYDQSVIFSMSAYAENEYVQLLEEAGAVGLALCAAFILIVAASYFRSIWKPRRPVHLAAYGLGFGLLAILIQSASDFGQHDAANACLTATFAALLIILARHARPMQQQRHGHSRRPRTWWMTSLRVAGAAAVMCLFIWPLMGADRARRARVLWQKTASVQELLDDKGWENGSNNDYIALLVPAAESAKMEPDDVFMGYWLNDFRWRSLERYRDPKTGVLALIDSSVKATAKMVAELNNLRVFCPTYGAPYSLAGRLEYFVLKRPVGAQDIRTGYQLDHNDPDACLAVAELDATLKRWDQSMAEAQRALELDPPAALPIVLRIYAQQGRPDIAYDLTRHDLNGLRVLAEFLSSDPAQKELVERCRREATALLFKAVESPDATDNELAEVAQIYDNQGKEDEAAKYYELALTKNYGQVDWRFRLAQLMIKSGNTTAAEKELRVCLRLRPSMNDAQSMLDKLTAQEAEAK